MNRTAVRPSEDLDPQTEPICDLLNAEPLYDHRPYQRNDVLCARNYSIAIRLKRSHAAAPGGAFVAVNEILGASEVGEDSGSIGEYIIFACGAYMAAAIAAPSAPSTRSRVSGRRLPSPPHISIPIAWISTMSSIVSSFTGQGSS